VLVYRTLCWTLAEETGKNRACVSKWEEYPHTPAVFEMWEKKEEKRKRKADGIMLVIVL